MNGYVQECVPLIVCARRPIVTWSRLGSKHVHAQTLRSDLGVGRFLLTTRERFRSSNYNESSLGLAHARCKVGHRSVCKEKRVKGTEPPDLTCVPLMGSSSRMPGLHGWLDKVLLASWGVQRCL